MNEPNEPELEKLIARSLSTLPDQVAPPSIASSVMATLRARQEAPWWRRSWFQWPAPWRIASATAALAIISVLLAATWSYWPDAAARYDTLARSGSTMMTTLATWFDDVSLRAWPYLGAVPTSVWFAGLGVIAACYLMCIGLGTAFARYFIFSKQTLRS